MFLVSRILGNESRAESLDLVRPGLAAGKHRAVSAGSTATALNEGFFGLMYLETPVMVLAGADAGDEDIDFAVGYRPRSRGRS